MRLIFIAVSLLLAACANQPNTDTVTVQWTPVSPERVRELCGSPYAIGCIKPYEGVCLIITPPMPEDEFSPFTHTMTSKVWTVLAHELYHCLGYEHR